jgi:membrane-associated phospholipid phosphatase
MVALAALLAAATGVLASIYDLPIRDPDSAAGPTFVRFPLILLAAYVVDVAPRAYWRRRTSRSSVRTLFAEVSRERWPWSHVSFVIVGLSSWYVTYSAFRNLKSYVPFVNGTLHDKALDKVDHVLFFGNDPATVLHTVLGTGISAHFLSFVYVAWIVLIPVSLVVAMVWSRDVAAAAWYVTAIGLNWVLGVATYFALPTLGPIYSRPELFDKLPPTDVATLQEMLLDDRTAVLAAPFATNAVQTIAAFASLHVAMCVTAVLIAELLRFPRWLRISLWVFLGLTVVSTVYFGWHFFVDTLGGAAIGILAVWIAALGTGNHSRGVPLALLKNRGKDMAEVSGAPVPAEDPAC